MGGAQPVARRTALPTGAAVTGQRLSGGPGGSPEGAGTPGTGRGVGGQLLQLCRALPVRGPLAGDGPLPGLATSGEQHLRPAGGAVPDDAARVPGGCSGPADRRGKPASRWSRPRRSPSTLRQSLELSGLDGGEVNERVRPSVVLRDEPEPLSRVGRPIAHPLRESFGHGEWRGHFGRLLVHGQSRWRHVAHTSDQREFAHRSRPPGGHPGPVRKISAAAPPSPGVIGGALTHLEPS